MNEQRGRGACWLLPLCVLSAACGQSTSEAPSTTHEGGQTGSGGLPLPFACNNPPQATCEGMLRFFPPLFDLNPLLRSACVTASSVHASLRDDTPVCRCTYEAPQGYSDTPRPKTEASFVLGLARRRMLRGEPGDTCERRIDYWGAPGTCLLEASDFAGCSLDDADRSCSAACQLVTERNRQKGAAVTSKLEFLGTRTTCCPEGSESPMTCFGAFRVNAQCGVAEYHSISPFSRSSLEEASCDQPVDELLGSYVDAYRTRYSLLQCSTTIADAGEPLPPGDAAVSADAAPMTHDSGLDLPPGDAAVGLDAAPGGGSSNP